MTRDEFLPTRKPARKRCQNCDGVIGARVGSEDGCMATRRCLATRPVPVAPLPRAVRELLRDVVLLERSAWPLEDALRLGRRAARILGTTPDAIVERARKVRK